MDTIFSQSFLRLYTLKILEMTVGRNKLSAKYRSADRDSLVGWWTSELVGVNSAAYRSTPLRPEEASAFVQDDGLKAERCLYYLLLFIGPLLSRIV